MQCLQCQHENRLHGDVRGQQDERTQPADQQHHDDRLDHLLFIGRLRLEVERSAAVVFDPRIGYTGPPTLGTNSPLVSMGVEIAA